MWSGNTLEERKTADIDGFRPTDAAEEHTQRAFNSDGTPIVAATGPRKAQRNGTPVKNGTPAKNGRRAASPGRKSPARSRSPAKRAAK